jgi:uncharacterized protein (TIGR03067 family)
MRSKAVVLLAVVFASAGVVAGGDDKGDLKQLAGIWSVVSARKAGKDAPENEIKNIRLVFSEDKITIKVGEKPVEGSFKIDPSKKPRQIDITLKDETGKGIYQFKGDTLEICLSIPGQARPTEFKAPESTKNTLLVLKREKS